MQSVLTLNGGSSSIRFAFYDTVPGATAVPGTSTVPGEVTAQGETTVHRSTAVPGTTRLLGGKLDRIGQPGTTLTIEPSANHGGVATETLQAADHGTAATLLLDRLAGEPLFATVAGIGHRVVHGMQHSKPERITSELLEELKSLRPYDPEHLPREIELIETVGRLQPKLPQVACFDTAFHRTMPRVATLLPIPRRYFVKGVQRYGFHGLSYSFLIAELARLGDPAATRGRVILAHLGNGASLAAVRDGRSIDTSMGFTPTSGIMMSTRSGDLDPGVVGFLAHTQAIDGSAFASMVTHESGLLGVSETSSDVRDLLAHESTDARAAEALELFCYQVRKCIGSYAAALGGLDTLVFAGGIGENSPQIRARVCQGLDFLGIDVDGARNSRGEGIIASDAARVAVRVIRTDEESVIAAATLQVLGL